MKRLILALLLAVTPAYAQKKKNPEPIDVDAANRPNVELFKDAYERAGQPTILVLAGIETGAGAGAALPQVATGAPQEVVERPRQVGSSLSLFDSTGDSDKLRGDIEEILLQNHDLDLVNLDALAEADRREIALLQGQDEQKAIQLLSQKVNAEVVLLVRMLGGSAIASRGAKYRVGVEVIHIPRGRTIGRFAFDWTQGVDSVQIKEYARAITRKFIEQFSAAYTAGPGGAALPFTVRLIGLENIAQLSKASKAFKEIDGVKSVQSKGFSGDKKDSVSTLTLKYVGSSLELADALQTAATTATGFDMRATDATGGTITLIAAIAPPPLPVVVAERWQIIMDESHPQHKEVVALILKEYEAEGRPKIGVIVSPALTEKELNDPGLAKQVKEAGGQSKEGAVLVNIGVAGRDAKAGTADAAAIVTSTVGADTRLDAQRVNDALNERLLKIGLRMADPNFARTKLLEEKAKDGRQVFEVNEIYSLLSRTAELDIVIHGVGRVDPSARSGVSYSFRAVRVKDAEILGSFEWSEKSEGRTAGAREVTAKYIADYATGKLLDQALTIWTR